MFRTVLEAQAAKQDAVAAVAIAGRGKVPFQGKATDLQRRSSEGFAQERLELDGLDNVNSCTQ